MKPFMNGQKYDEYAKKHPGSIGFTDKQYESLKALLADIRSRHPDVKDDRRHIIAHSDYAPDRRTDPGELFDWARIGLQKAP